MFAVLTTILAPAATALACGGFFCTTATINQQVERIIFAHSGRAITAYVQINYTGSDADFAWVVPVPSVPQVDVAGVDMFTELDTLTSPVFIGPPLPEGCPIAVMAVAEDSSGGGVTVYSSGVTGPFAFDVIGSDDPLALINWLKDNGYRIEPEMEPLVHVYVEEHMLFLAMKLRPGQGVQDIQPVKMSYESEWPMIPLRLTAVAANPNMGVLVWLLGEAQYESDNYRKLEVRDDEIQFDFFGGHNYFLLRSQRVDEVRGQGFITEYAGPTGDLVAVDGDLRSLLGSHAYLTRMYTEISPEEMTVDPTFRYNANLPPVSNVHDLSQGPFQYDCGTPPADPGVVTIYLPNVGAPPAGEEAPPTEVRIPIVWLLGGAVGGVLLVAALAAAYVAGRRAR
jgi:hypothetical protein